jgi:hypothetical protein
VQRIIVNGFGLTRYPEIVSHRPTASPASVSGAFGVEPAVENAHPVERP